jgi:hypothetical protein
MEQAVCAAAETNDSLDELIAAVYHNILELTARVLAT